VMSTFTSTGLMAHIAMARKPSSSHRSRENCS
jgi:hypothetical protein